METLFIYLLKASALLTTYFIAYHFLLRKETFFTTNRWFLLAGLFTSAVLPLLFIKKIVLVEQPKIDSNEALNFASQINSAITSPEVVIIDWNQIILLGYGIIASLLLINILTHLFSLFKLLHKKEVVKKEQYSLVDINEEIAPFSFFKYIVYNSRFYSNDELNSILQHEKIHSKEIHSFDVLLAKFFCILFWFNPFMWLYKKAIIQNLEYIADYKAVQQIQDKKVYQKALLKVVSHQNYLSITSHFYQSLIKKRIVMLNKNQSNQRNAWKYVLIIPALVAFVIFFQVKVIAQEKASIEILKKAIAADVIPINKNTSDIEMKENKEKLKLNFNVVAKFSKLKRNKNGELTSIKVDIKTPQGKSEIFQFSGNEPIKPFTIVVNQNKNGIVNVDISSNSNTKIKTKIIRNSDEVSNNEEENDFSYSFSTDDEIVDFEAPEVPDAPEEPMGMRSPMPMRAPNAPNAPRFPHPAKGMNKSIVIKRSNNQKPTVIINGEVINDEEIIESLTNDLEGMDEININSDDAGEISISRGSNNQRVKIIRKKEIDDIAKKAMENARVQMKRVSPDIEISKAEMEKAKEEMLKAKMEMEKAREEMLQAKAEMIKAKSKTKKAKIVK